MVEQGFMGQANQTAKAEKEAYERQAKEKELRNREQRLQQHREYLNEQMQIRQDYYSLGLVHKMIILVLFLTLSTFVAFLVLSYIPATKHIVHNVIYQLL